MVKNIQIRNHRFEIFTLMVVGGILFYQLMIPPIVGLANNGDFWRVMKWGGIQYPTGKDEDYLFHYIHRTFLVKPETQYRFYVSSEIIFAQIGFLFNKVISKNGLFDIRVLGFVHSVFFLSALLFILYVSGKIEVSHRWVLSIILIFIFCDVGYIAYFNSFYAEPASLIFLLFMISFLLYITMHKQPKIWSLVTFFISAVCFIGAKHQNSILGFLLAPFFFHLSFLRSEKHWKHMSIILSLFICIFSFGFFKSTPRFIKEAVLYNTIFYEILKKSPSPDEDLKALGLRKEWISLVGTHAFMPIAPINDKEFRDKFFTHMGYCKIFKFYIIHPKRLSDLLKIGAKNAFSMRFPGYLGNFEKSAGFMPAAQSQAFALYSNLKEHFFPKSLWVLSTIFFLSTLSIAIVRVKSRSMMSRVLSEFYFILVFMAVAQFFISVIGAGEQDLAKHLFLFNVFVDIFIITVIFIFLWRMVTLWQSVKNGLESPFLKMIFWAGERRKRISLIVTGIGILVLSMSVLADTIGIGGYPGFGWKQAVGSGLGVLIATAGLLLNRRYRKDCHSAR